MNQKQWMERFVEDVGVLGPVRYIPRLKEVLSMTWEEAHNHGYDCGFKSGAGDVRNELDAVLRDLWVEEGPGVELDGGFLRALETVAEHFGLGIDDEDSEDNEQKGIS